MEYKETGKRNKQAPNLIGKTFGKLKVIKRLDDQLGSKEHYHHCWLCECNCEKHTILPIMGFKLIGNLATSCGCDKKQKQIEKGKKTRKLNKYDLSGEYGIGWTNNTNKKFLFDLEDYDKIKDYAWNEGKRKKGQGYVVSSRELPRTSDGKRHSKSILFHHLIVPYPLTDHINQNKMDNRKENLRKCTQSQNMMNVGLKKNNTSGFIGVTKNGNGWLAKINPSKGKRISLGWFKNKEDAIIARLKAEKQYYGDFAPQRHLFQKYGIEDN